MTASTMALCILAGGSCRASLTSTLRGSEATKARITGARAGADGGAPTAAGRRMPGPRGSSCPDRQVDAARKGLLQFTEALFPGPKSGLNHVSLGGYGVLPMDDLSGLWFLALNPKIQVPTSPASRLRSARSWGPAEASPTASSPWAARILADRGLWPRPAPGATWNGTPRRTSCSWAPRRPWAELPSHPRSLSGRDRSAFPSRRSLSRAPATGDGLPTSAPSCPLETGGGLAVPVFTLGWAFDGAGLFPRAAGRPRG
jgi:hypothetical protein